MKSFRDKLAVVTGGGSGMGRELVRQLADQGCHVAFCDVTDDNMAGTLALCSAAIADGVRVSAHHCDVADETAVMRFREEVAEQHGCDYINLLFNNAGISGGASFLRDERANWDRTFAICWGGVYNCCRVFLPALEASDAAHIVNTSSVNGFWACLGLTSEHSAYSTAKFAVKGFSESLVIDLRHNAPHIKISVVMPGHIGTDIARNSQEKSLGDPLTMPAENVARVRAKMARTDPSVSELGDDAVRQLMVEAGRMFKEEAPLNAAQAVELILEGVREERWRILVGEDAEMLDAAVRADPEGIYDTDFLALDVAGFLGSGQQQKTQGR